MRLGLTHLAITDHERIDGGAAGRRGGRGPGTADGRLTVIVGEEVRTP